MMRFLAQGACPSGFMATQGPPHRRYWTVGLGSSLLVIGLLGCSLPASNSAGATSRSSTSSLETTDPGATAPKSADAAAPQAGQVLPITAEADLGDRLIQLEVAHTREQQQVGLMYRNQLADDRGMLFPFDPPRPVSFWMKNVQIPLDMVFLYQGQVVAIAQSVPPCEAEPCPTYGPGRQLVDAVIELRGDLAAEIGLQVGDTVDIRWLEAPADSPDP